MTIYVLIATCVVLFVFILIVVFHRKTHRKSVASPYVDALHAILEGHTEDAFEKLKKTVKHDTDNIMAYIMLGDLFRKRGYPIRAAKTHRSLLVRSDLNESQITTILNQLVLDYRANGSLDKAIEMAERLVQRDKKNLENQKLLLALFEEKCDWDKAFSFKQGLAKSLKQKDPDRLALYKVESGLQMARRGSEKEGRIRFREAIKLNKQCIPAYLYWGDSYHREGRKEDACRVWRELTAKNPTWSHLAFGRLKEVLFDLGRYGEMEEICQNVLRKKPGHVEANLHLAELYKKQGLLDEALDRCRKALENDPTSSWGHELLIRLYRQKGDEATALNEAIGILNRGKQNESVYTCTTCGHQSVEPIWRCPQCKAWNSFLPQS